MVWQKSAYVRVLLAVLIVFAMTLPLNIFHPDQAHAAMTFDIPEILTLNATNDSSANGVSIGLKTISDSGEWIAYASHATNMVSQTDSNGEWDVFLTNTITKETRLLSKNTAGTSTGNNYSEVPIVSPNGQYVIFQSAATNLSTYTDNNNEIDLYIYDIANDNLKLITKNYQDTSAVGVTNFDWGRSNNYVYFTSQATNLVEGLTTSDNQLFRYNVTTEQIELMSTTDGGTTGATSVAMHGYYGNYSSAVTGSESADSRYVVYRSNVPTTELTNPYNKINIMLYDTVDHDLKIISKNQESTYPGNEDSFHPWISNDGKKIFYISFATNLVNNPHPNNAYDIYMYDVDADTNTRLTNSEFEFSPTNGYPSLLDITDDGKYVSFFSPADDMTEHTYPELEPASGLGNIFRADTESGDIELVTETLSGNAGSGTYSTSVGHSTMSNDGRFIAFSALGNDYSAEDNNNADRNDVFLRDMVLGETKLIDSNETGTNSPNYGADYPLMNPSGGTIVFSSISPDLDPYNASTTPSKISLYQSTMGETYTSTTETMNINESVEYANVMVNRSGNPRTTFTVDYETVPGSADENVDYTHVSGTLVFNPGEIQKTVQIPILDSPKSTSRTLFLDLSNGINVEQSGLWSTLIYIQEDAPPPTTTTTTTTTSTTVAPIGDAELEIEYAYSEVPNELDLKKPSTGNIHSIRVTNTGGNTVNSINFTTTIDEANATSIGTNIGLYDTPTTTWTGTLEHGNSLILEIIFDVDQSAGNTMTLCVSTDLDETYVDGSCFEKNIIFDDADFRVTGEIYNVWDSENKEVITANYYIMNWSPTTSGINPTVEGNAKSTFNVFLPPGFSLNNIEPYSYNNGVEIGVECEEAGLASTMINGLNDDYDGYNLVFCTFTESSVLLQYEYVQVTLHINTPADFVGNTSIYSTFASASEWDETVRVSTELQAGSTFETINSNNAHTLEYSRDADEANINVDSVNLDSPSSYPVTGKTWEAEFTLYNVRGTPLDQMQLTIPFIDRVSINSAEASFGNLDFSTMIWTGYWDDENTELRITLYGTVTGNPVEEASVFLQVSSVGYENNGVNLSNSSDLSDSTNYEILWDVTDTSISSSFGTSGAINTGSNVNVNLVWRNEGPNATTYYGPWEIAIKMLLVLVPERFNYTSSSNNVSCMAIPDDGSTPEGYDGLLCTINVTDNNYNWPANSSVNITISGTATSNFVNNTTKFYAATFAHESFEQSGGLTEVFADGFPSLSELEESNSNDVAVLTYSVSSGTTTTTTTTTTVPTTPTTTVAPTPSTTTPPVIPATTVPSTTPKKVIPKIPTTTSPQTITVPRFTATKNATPQDQQSNTFGRKKSIGSLNEVSNKLAVGSGKPANPLLSDPKILFPLFLLLAAVISTYLYSRHKYKTAREQATSLHQGLFDGFVNMRK